MSKLSEKISYLQGLAEGLRLNAENPEGRILMEVIEALKLATEKLDYVEETMGDLSEFVDEIDGDLAELEDYIAEEEFEDEDCDCCCDDEELIYECPHCGCEVELENVEADLEDDIKCPKCGDSIFYDEEEK